MREQDLHVWNEAIERAARECDTYVKAASGIRFGDNPKPVQDAAFERQTAYENAAGAIRSLKRT